jgi:kinetochore protein NDC80
LTSVQSFKHAKSLEELVQKRDSYATDLEQFHDLIHQMDQHVATLKNKKNNQSEELEETSKSLAKIVSKVQQLKGSIGNQELSLDDVQKMQNERKGVEEAIERALALRDQRRSALWEIESEVDKSWSDLESFVSDYSSYVGDLKLVPIVSSKGIEMEAVVNKDAVLDPNLSKLLDIDLPGIIQPTLTSCHEEYCSLISDSKWKYQEALDKLERSEEEFTEALERNRIVENKIDKCEETMEAERDAQDAKLGVRVREADSIETKVASLRDPVALEEQMTQFERQCSELEAMRQQHEEDNVARKKAVCEEIDQAIVSMKEYDEFCLEKIKEVQQYRKNKQSKYGKLKSPSTMEPSE